MTAQEVKQVRYFVHGEPRVSESQDFFDIYDASTGEVIAQVPDCTEKEVDLAVQSAKEHCVPRLGRHAAHEARAGAV